jgi:hypothetical protein
MAANPGEDQPIVAGGASHHITLTVRGSSARSKPKTFSLTPKDPAVPFKEIVIMDGAKEVIRWPLSKKWKLIIS